VPGTFLGAPGPLLKGGFTLWQGLFLKGISPVTGFRLTNLPLQCIISKECIDFNANLRRAIQWN
jgi:hypothetical protein